ncbi:MAG TPA: hypothetical protein VGI61_08880 [Parafilimonas sp.]
MHVAESYSDEVLLNALKRSQEIDNAIRNIYKNYYGLLENYIINNKGNKEDAADIIQETIVAFVEIVHLFSLALVLAAIKKSTACTYILKTLSAINKRALSLSIDFFI